MDTTKRCRSCQRDLPLASFYRGYAKCKQCYSLHRGHQPKERVPNGYRRCSKCNLLLEETDANFYRDRRGDYFRGHCKSCMNNLCAEYAETRREELKAYYRDWRIRVRSGQHLKRKPKSQARLDNQTLREATRRFRRNNPASYRASMQRRAARKKSLPDTLTANDWRVCLDYWRHQCCVCGSRQKLCAEHWIPLSSPNCPGTVVSNIVVMCLSCNSSKHNSVAELWLVGRLGNHEAGKVLKRIEAYFEQVRNHD